MSQIYLDYAATTPVDSRVLAEMVPYFSTEFGNASSSDHVFGWIAEEAVKKARKQISSLINASSNEIIFTSGATESNNLALKGISFQYQSKGTHIISCVTEHKSVLDSLRFLQDNGFEITYLKVNQNGLLDLHELEAAITPKTILISLMTANNETGIIHPISEIGALAQKHGVFFHTDATQAAGKIPIDVKTMNVDMLSLSAHKMYGPKGVGALFVKKKSPKIELAPIIHGGGHEHGIRSGTLNVPGIVGFGAACHYCALEMDEEAARLIVLREKLKSGIEKSIDRVRINGHETNRLPGILNISIAGIENVNLIRELQDIAISSGSACTSEVIGPSHVIEAMGVEPEYIRSAVRFSLGRFTTETEIDYVIQKIVKAANSLRELN